VEICVYTEILLAGLSEAQHACLPVLHLLSGTKMGHTLL